METIVNPISRAPSREASSTPLPCSMWRTMFSNITIASSTTKPTDNVSASRDMLSTVKPSAYITANVPMIDIGNAKLGISVAEAFRRKRKITNTTRAIARNKLNFTSSTDC